MRLSKELLPVLDGKKDIQAPVEDHLRLPEKVLQFGTGVLLRGLPDYFIDKANKTGLFNGRIVVVKSTGKGTTDAFAEQDGLYTQCIRGIEDGQAKQENILNAAISRVLSAATQWQEILQCAENPAMEIVISNTTEVGITLTDDDVHAVPPVSYPGKLLAFLYRRYEYFKGSADKGMVIIPTELIPDNGRKLRDIVLELAASNNLPEAFIRWLSSANHFCNSLVDRIVPGALPAAEQQEMEAALGYEDALMIMSEVYRLWAIETTDAGVKERLGFAAADKGVVLAPNINVFRELKLRLLNGTHTLSCGLAFLAGFDTVQAAMEAPDMEAAITALMMEEMAPAITDIYITETAATQFAASVLDRFRNPHIAHQWLSITMQYTSKMKMRNVPVLLRHYQRSQEAPHWISLGFAAYLLFMRSERGADGAFKGTVNGETYTIQDDHASWFYEQWKRLEPSVLVKEVLANTALWGTDLTLLKGFAPAVNNMLQQLLQHGAKAVVENFNHANAGK
ncbi:tagaturonate reductase [uncultured Chitinophaga sp.]|jgi:Mannitol-1-phosphate/altronate dehydrogenases|uniref:tagaturonate reductase n=1 Tax=uncultured Chitinophaga sp. TaxID=339340 RepID=UPI00263043D5|nr:tagaturonate reductase [uncultured Chitinophaga sp.]